MNPILSIIIPCYNGERYLADAVNSLLKQPCQDLEIIIVDDGSRDASGAIADRFAQAHENIRVFHIPNSGVSVARNIGIDQASGRYIGFLDADDVLCRDAYDQEIHHALQSEQYDIFSFSYLSALENMAYGRLVPVNAPGVYLREGADYIPQTEKHFCSYLYSRKLFSERVRFPAGIRYNEDMCFLFLITRSAGHIRQYEKPWFLYRLHASSVMHSLSGTWYLLEAIEGIAWCLKNSTGEKNIRDCRGNLFACMVKYIRVSCMQGISPKIIRENMMKNDPFQEVMTHYGTFWCNDQDAHLYEGFMKTPVRIWLKYRLKGIGHFAAQRLIRTKPGSVVNQKLRYKLPLKDYLVG